MNRSRGTLSTIAALAAIGATAAIALAAPSNGNFEEGSLKGWDQTNESGGLTRGMAATDKWKAYKGKLQVADIGASRGIDGPPQAGGAAAGEVRRGRRLDGSRAPHPAPRAQRQGREQAELPARVQKHGRRLLFA